MIERSYILPPEQDEPTEIELNNEKFDLMRGIRERTGFNLYNRELFEAKEVLDAFKQATEEPDAPSGTELITELERYREIVLKQIELKKKEGDDKAVTDLTVEKNFINYIFANLDHAENKPAELEEIKSEIVDIAEKIENKLNINLFEISPEVFFDAARLAELNGEISKISIATELWKLKNAFAKLPSQSTVIQKKYEHIKDLIRYFNKRLPVND